MAPLLLKDRLPAMGATVALTTLRRLGPEQERYVMMRSINKLQSFTKSTLLAALLVAAPIGCLGSSGGDGSLREEVGTASEALSGVIQYGGGAVMTQGVNVYYIWYGSWANTSKHPQLMDAVGILTGFGGHIGGSPYFDINTTYYDANNQHVRNSVKLAGGYTDAYSQGVGVIPNLRMVVQHALDTGALPLDVNGVYFVLPSPDVDGNAQCGGNCGWHTAFPYQGPAGQGQIKWAYIGSDDACLCIPANTGSDGTKANSSPNGNYRADSMASTIAHELEESATDPGGHGWKFPDGSECADACAYTKTPWGVAPNGQRYNMQLGDRFYLIQPNWVNVGDGGCAISYP
jgi:hypothetical protein